MAEDYKKNGSAGEEGNNSSSGGRFSKLESFLGKSVSEGSRFSWGLVILLVVAIYAAIRFIRSLAFFHLSFGGVIAVLIVVVVAGWIFFTSNRRL